MAKNAETTEKATKVRLVAGVNYNPADVYNYAVEHAPVSAQDLSERFSLGSAQKAKMVVFDYCIEESKIPPRFAARGNSASGLLVVSEVHVPVVDPKTKKPVLIRHPKGKKGADGKVKMVGQTKLSGYKLVIPNAYLKAVNAGAGSMFSVQIDETNGALTLVPVTRD